MEANPLLGVLLHAIGGLAAASFYIPYQRVRGWAWETFWIVGGVFAWILVPWLVASLKSDDLLVVLNHAPGTAVVHCYLFGLMWGIGGLMYGLTMRYLGISLGVAIALGFCAACGTLIPPMFNGQFHELLHTQGGWATLAGVAICLLGIAICGLAGMRKEQELTDDQKQDTVTEFSFAKGVLVAVIAGIMSACMAFAIAAGKPIADLSIEHGTESLWCNLPVFVVAFAGGFTTNVCWCIFLNIRNRTASNYLWNDQGGQLVNYLFCALGGTVWYMQFMFYGMGTTQMGRYDFSSWTIHMAFIIIFGTLWGLWLHEWRGVHASTIRLVWMGIGLLIVSTVVVGWGNYLAG
jgi:L-rhamnose-H+ transport protein